MCRCVTAASLGLCCSGEQCRSGKGWASDCACEHSHGFIGSVSCRHLCHRTSAAGMHSLIFCCCDILGSFAGDPGISHDQGWVRVRRRRGPSCCLFIGWMVCAGPGCLGRISRKMLPPLGTGPSIRGSMRPGVPGMIRCSCVLHGRWVETAGIQAGGSALPVGTSRRVSRRPLIWSWGNEYCV